MVDLQGDTKIETEIGREYRSVALVSLGCKHIPDISAQVSV